MQQFRFGLMGLLLVPMILAAQAPSDEALPAGPVGAGAADGQAEPESAMEPEGETGRQRSLGLRFASPAERFTLHTWLRAQTRYSTPFDDDPLTPWDFQDAPGGDLDLRRARIKAAGRLGHPRVEYYYEHELSGDAPLLDLRVDIELGDSWDLRIGQYKILFNRERVDSSGRQTFVDRSIANYAFALDRQRGVTVTRRWAPGTPASQRLVLGVFEGDSRNPGPRGDEPMWLARWQWAFLGEDLPFSQSDLVIRDKPAATFALAAATVKGPYTRFSGSGGGQLDGYAQGGNERYRLQQWLQEFALHYRGLSIQQEFHVKQIEDRELRTDSTLRGGYLQVGKVWRSPLRASGLPFELAARYGRVDWNDSPVERDQRELTLAGNVFFDGHDNKLTMEVSRLELAYAGSRDRSDTRWRLQWDVSF